ncbi:hypothetical protein ACTGJ9_037560 [Bradyrhizobium sp. RDM12]
MTKRIEQLPVILIKNRPALFLPTDVLKYRFKRAFGFYGRLLPSHRLRSVTDRELPAIFSKWFMEGYALYRRGWCAIIDRLSPAACRHRRGSNGPPEFLKPPRPAPPRA